MDQPSLHKAILEHNAEMVNALIQTDTNIHAIDSNGHTPLHLSAIIGDMEILKILMKAGAEVDVIFSDGQFTPLHMATMMRKTEIVKELIKAGANVNARITNGRTPVHIAAILGYTEVLKVLISASADVNVEDKAGLTALYRAVENNNLEILNVLIEARATVHVSNGSMPPLVCMATAKSNVDMIEALIKAGLDVNDLHRTWRKPLMFAIEVGNMRMLKVLLEGGAEVDAGEKLAGRALHRAVELENVEIVKALIKAGADVNIQDIFTGSPLHYAAENGNVEIAKALIKAGADVSERHYIHNTTPMLIATRKAWPPMDTKFPSNNLSCAQVMVKYSALQHYGNFRLYIIERYRKEFDRVLEFYKACFEELAAMANDLIDDKASLYDYLNQTDHKIQYSIARSDCISDAILQRVLAMKYPIYCDVLCEYLGRSYFEEKFTKFNFCVQLQSLETGRKREITLNSDSMQAIAKYVSLQDLANFCLHFCGKMVK